MAWCKRCGKLITWVKMPKGWVPYDANGKDHRDSCVPDPEYIKKRERIMKLSRPKKEKVQIGENEFI